MEKFSADEERIRLWAGLRQILGQISGKLRRQFIAVLVMMLLGAAAELATIGSVIPFLALLSQPSASLHLPWPATIFQSAGTALGTGAIVAAAIVFSGFAILAGVVRLQLTWLTQDFVYRLSHELALETQRRILFQPYAFHIHRNTSNLISATEKVEILVLDLILPIMQMIIASFIAVFLVAALLYIDPVATLLAAAGFAAVYILASVVTRNRLAANSGVMGTAYNERMQIISESLGGIRDVIIDDSRAMHLGLFDRVNSRLAHARATTAFIASAPRFVIESVGIVIIAAIAVLASSRPGGIGLALPFLGALALGAQRLLPLVQTIYTGSTVAAGNRSILAQVLEMLRLPLPKVDPTQADDPLPLKDRIRFEDVRFCYPTRAGSAAIEGVTFEIPRGAMVALVGETGSGKTTLADLLMGLLEPDSGQILVDGKPIDRANAGRWQRSIAHVPQSIFLADSTIARNIALALGDEPLDDARIVEAARKAQLDEFVSVLPQGYETIVGERGIRLSGGQRQRLGLARAIYKDSAMLVLDEPTSALDETTEAAVIDALEGLQRDGRTIMIIAHRRSTVERCDLVVRLHKGRLAQIGSFDELFGAASAWPERRRKAATRRRTEPR